MIARHSHRLGCRCASGAALLIAALSALRERRRVGTAANLLRSGRDHQTAVCRRRCDAFVQQRQSVAYGLNEVETLRQNDGLSGTLYNVPMIIGPSSFAVLLSTETGAQVQAAGNDTWHQPHYLGHAQSIAVDRAARGGPNNRPAARLATGCVPVTPTPGRSTASRRSMLPTTCRSTATTT